MIRKLPSAPAVLIVFVSVLVLAGFLVLAAGVPAAAAQAAPFAGQGGQMPDPKQISGMPLPVADLPPGTVTARVIRGQLTNPLQDQTVELAGSGPTKTAKTDAAGRATFADLTPGSHVKMSVTVGTEKIESREFDVPPQGGIRVMLVATDAATEARAAEEKKLAAEPPVQGTIVLGDQSRVVIEIGDDALNVFNLMQIVNTARRRVVTPRPLVFELPKEAVGAGLLEGSSQNAVAAGSKVTVNGPFAPGVTSVQFAYSIPLGRETITINQRMPAQLTQISVVAQKLPGMELASPQITNHRDMQAEGQMYIVGQGGGVRAGDVVSIALSGLPHRPTWPRNVALTLAVVILGAGAWGATRRQTDTPARDRRRKLQAQRDSLFAKLTALETERRNGKIDAAAYAAKRESLVTALEDLYAGLDHEAVA
ncbi:MAG TPA: hypothetical protein VFZ98_11895 [Vicinamibacterales bacterium]